MGFGSRPKREARSARPEPLARRAAPPPMAAESLPIYGIGRAYPWLTTLAWAQQRQVFIDSLIEQDKVTAFDSFKAFLP